MAGDDGGEVAIPDPPDRPDAEPAGGEDGADGGWSLSVPGGRLAKVGLAVLVVLGSVAGAFLYLSQPAEPGPEVDPAPAQTAVHDALVPFGYPAVLVDVTDQRVLVRYEQPANLSRELAYALARDSAALHAPDGTEDVVVEIYVDVEPRERRTVPVDVVRSYLNGTATRAELEAATAVEDLGS